MIDRNYLYGLTIIQNNIAPVLILPPSINIAISVRLRRLRSRLRAD